MKCSPVILFRKFVTGGVFSINAPEFFCSMQDLHNNVAVICFSNFECFSIGLKETVDPPANTTFLRRSLGERRKSPPILSRFYSRYYGPSADL